jgi:hypothetical protein
MKSAPGLQESEAEHDRQAALAFLFQTIRFGAGQRAHERRFAVVDMTDDAERQRPAHDNASRTARLRVRV